MQISREPGPVKGGKTNIAFVEDPTGYKFELIEREKATQEPFCQVMLRVSNLDKSIEYYEKCLGMKLLRKRENPGAPCTRLSSNSLSWPVEMPRLCCNTRLSSRLRPAHS